MVQRNRLKGHERVSGTVEQGAQSAGKGVPLTPSFHCKAMVCVQVACVCVWHVWCVRAVAAGAKGMAAGARLCRAWEVSVHMCRQIGVQVRVAEPAQAWLITITEWGYHKGKLLRSSALLVVTLNSRWFELGRDRNTSCQCVCITISQVS